MNKSTLIAVIIGAVLVGVALMLSRTSTESVAPVSDGSNVTMVDGVQVITIDAKGGYTPKKSVAQSGVETVIRFNTTATFDCSAAVRIPSLDVSKTLPQSGSTDIPIGVPGAGPLKGMCGMGMYHFEVDFVE